jgi:hypothetical protein
MRFNYTLTDIFTTTNLKLSAANYGECTCCRIQLFLFNIYGDSQLALF